MPSLRIDKPPGEAVRQLARKQVNLLRKELGEPASDASIHGMRRRIKFLRSLLRFIRACLDEQQFNSANGALREAAGELAHARRAAALQQAVARLAVAHQDPSLDELSRLLASHHDEDLAPESIAAALAAARNRIDSEQKQLKHWSLPKSDTDLYLAGMARCYGRARKTLEKGLAEADIVILHEARKSVIHYLHHIEMLQRLWPVMMKLWVSELDRLRRALGDLNDLEELAQFAASAEAAFEAEKTRQTALEIIAGARKVLLKKAVMSEHHLFAESPKALAKRIGAMWQSMRE